MEYYPIFYKQLYLLTKVVLDLAVQLFQQVMGPNMTMNNLNTNSNSDMTTLAVPKLHDDGSNWSNYQPRIQNAMGAKGLWRHVEGTATAPVRVTAV